MHKQILTICLIFILAACAKTEKKADKEPEKKETAKIYTTSPPKTFDWCRACVLSPQGWMSCQRITGKSGERQLLKARARQAACIDAGFQKDNCKDSSVLTISCKGDKSKSKNENSKKVKNIIKKLFPDKIKISSGAAPETDSKDKAAIRAGEPDNKTNKGKKSSPKNIPVIPE